MCSPLPKILVRHLKCSLQTNANDCGVYAIANMVSILNGIDPSGITYTCHRGLLKKTPCPSRGSNRDSNPMPLAYRASTLPTELPSHVVVLWHTVSKMRDHLMKGLENKNITVFPHRKLSVVREPLIKVTGISLFCTCRMPDFGFMFTCSKCKQWFHPRCQNITQSVLQIKTSKNIKCLNCRS